MRDSVCACSVLIGVAIRCICTPAAPEVQLKRMVAELKLTQEKSAEQVQSAQLEAQQIGKQLAVEKESHAALAAKYTKQEVNQEQMVSTLEEAQNQFAELQSKLQDLNSQVVARGEWAHNAQLREAQLVQALSDLKEQGSAERTKAEASRIHEEVNSLQPCSVSDCLTTVPISLFHSNRSDQPSRFCCVFEFKALL